VILRVTRALDRSCYLFFELYGLRAKLIVGHCLHRHFERIDLVDYRMNAFEKPLVAAAEKLG
jgi:hypothetical protein